MALEKTFLRSSRNKGFQYYLIKSERKRRESEAEPDETFEREREREGAVRLLLPVSPAAEKLKSQSEKIRTTIEYTTERVKKKLGGNDVEEESSR